MISVKNNYANQIVLKLAYAADKKGNQTLNIITKFNTLMTGSESEAIYISIARNQDMRFCFEWYVLKNMNFKKGEWSLMNHDVKEREFFSQGIWEDMSWLLLDIDQLWSRLSKVLFKQITAELLSLIEEIEVKLSTCCSQLNKLEASKTTLAEQWLYLLQLSQSFQSLIKTAVNNTYNDLLFKNAKFESDY